MTQRVAGKTLCMGCGQEVEVVYPYTNSDKCLGLVDHEVPADQREAWRQPGEMVRCQHAGLSIWTSDLGWHERFYPAESITWLAEREKA